MIANILTILVLVLLVLLFGWLTSRAWRARNPVLRGLATLITGLLTLIFAFVTVMTGLGIYKLNAAAPNPVSSLTAKPSPEKIAVAQQKAQGCAGCHSTAGNLPLDGGNTNFLAGGPPLGALYAPNLTPGGPLKDWSDGEIIRAIREGVDKNGHPLMIMPSGSFRSLSDEDVQALVAVLRAQPPVAHDVPERSLTVLGDILIGAGLFPTSAQPSITQPVVAPPAGVSVAYGEYLVKTLGCRECHGPDLAGIPNRGGGPSGPNLTVLVPTWSEADFVKTIRTGVDPKGKQLDPAQMPWKDISKSTTDDDLKAMNMYLHGLTPIQK